MDLIEVTRALPPALERRKEWAVREHASVTARVLKRSLLECLVCTRMASQRYLAFVPEFEQAGAYLRSLLDRVAQIQSDQLTRLEETNSEEVLPPAFHQFLLRVAQTSLAANNTQVGMILNLDRFRMEASTLLFLNLLAVLEEQDEEPTRAFLSAARTSVVDLLIGLIPGADLVMVAVRAAEAAIRARSTQRQSADAYLDYVEKQRDALLAWVNAADIFIDGLRTMRGAPPIHRGGPDDPYAPPPAWSS
ncbi:hypothetical protein ACFQS7_26670 [Dankookia sp. GCM10030260]|uniref:hypothetical protein n=1 Tax=Dankookia sp. GCM10030260 TaxID=3273390 RepID=UPI003611174A